MADGEVMEIGGMRVRHIDTPHVPHGWDARVIFEETTKTLLCGDLFTHLGNGPAVTENDVVGPAMDAEALFRSTCLAPDTTAVMRKLGRLEPATLALMHGSTFKGDGQQALDELATAYGGELFRI